MDCVSYLDCSESFVRKSSSRVLWCRVIPFWIVRCVCSCCDYRLQWFTLFDYCLCKTMTDELLEKGLAQTRGQGGSFWRCDVTEAEGGCVYLAGAGFHCSVSTLKCVCGCCEEPKFWESSMLFPRTPVWKYLCFKKCIVLFLLL